MQTENKMVKTVAAFMNPRRASVLLYRNVMRYPKIPDATNANERFDMPT